MSSITNPNFENISAGVHSVSGAVSALLAMTLVYPLDNLRTRLQVNRRENIRGVLGSLDDILRSEGIIGLYAGLRSALLGVGVSWAVYYYFYALFRMYSAKKFNINPNLGTASLLIAMSSGVISAICTNPIWVVNTRIKLRQTQCSFLGALKELFDEEGTRGLLSGLLPSLILVLNPAIQFAVYEQLKATCITYKDSLLRRDFISGRSIVSPKIDISSTTLTGSEIFVIGAISKLIATVATYPQQVIKSRLQARQNILHSEGYGGAIDCVVKIFEQEGLSGFFRGMQSKLVATGLTSAIMFLTYESILRTIHSTYMKVKIEKSF